ncbi:hypothetical protein MBLNU457_3739t1 [Dothideomycetes sp. NU457]
MPDAPSSSLQTPSPTRRILSRLASPFTPKGRTVPEFFVQAEDPHKHYSPGDLVRGSVILKISKPTRVTHIVVCLHGFVQVYKNPGAPPADGFRTYNNRLGKGRGSKSGAEYFGNGFATLFEDETVICGDGRLEEGNYKFEFQMKFPNSTLPSSIDFERGTVSYMITATMTRPTSMAPVIFHDQKINFVEKIDISRLLPPKPRTITLEPLVRRHRAKTSSKRRRNTNDTQGRDGASTTSTARQPSTFSPPGTPLSDAPPRTPSPSAQSLNSQQSSNCHTSVSGSMITSSRASDTLSGSHGTNGHNSGKVRTITATVESLRGGCLGGDTLPIKIVIYHTKHIMSMKGVIVTLYRHARVDTHPEIPIGPMSAKDRRKNDDYYPKSLTGLGGLSLSGAGSSHVFRKDLSQVVVPLIVDPKTLTTEITPKLRVPDDAFPSISCVPGSMISFKYYVEVIIDIQGKLSGQERYFTPGQDAAASSSQPQFADMESGFAADSSGQQRFNQGIVDTAPIRRDKSVVTCVLEVIIGTRDSERAKGKGRALPDTESPSQSGPTGMRQPSGATNGFDGQHNNSPFRHSPRTQITSSQTSIDRAYTYLPPPAFEPPSTIHFEEGLSEKERLRRHEQSLLPSQPPGMDEDFASRAQASAPVLEHANGDPSLYTGMPSDFSGGEGSSSGAALQYRPDPSDEPYAVYAHDPNMTSDWIAEQAPPSDDKLEMERRHLESQVSEPPVAEDEASAGPSNMPLSFHVPTEDEVEGYVYPDEGSSQQQYSHSNGDQDYHHLPRYER